MRRRLIPHIGSLRLRRIVLVGGASALAGLVLLAALLAFLPTLLSTSQMQSLLRLRISNSLKKPVSWSNLTLSWSDGVALSGLMLGEGPAPLLSASVGELRLVPGFGRDGSGRLGVSLDLRVKKLEAHLAPGPKKPPEEKPAKDPLTQVAEAVQKFQTMQWPLPVDLRVSIDAAPMTLSYRDTASGRDVVLRNLAFRLAVPSLARLPMETSLTGSVAVAGAKPQPISFSAKVSELVDGDDRISPAGALFSAKARLPGAEFGAGGGVNRPGGLNATLRLALPELTPVVAALAHRRLPSLAGKVALDLKGDVDRKGDLQLLFDMGADGLAAGMPGKKGSAGPLDLRLHQKLVSDHKRQRVSFADGSLTSHGLVSASWEATVDRPTERSRSVVARLGPLRLDLARARQLAAPFLPKDLPLTELKGTASIGKIAARLQGPENDGELTLEGAAVELRQLKLRLPAGALQGEGLSLVLEQGTVPLKGAAPASLAGDVAFSAAGLELAGKKPVLVRGMKGKLNVSLGDIDLKGKRAVAKASQWLEIEQIKVGGELAVDQLREELRVIGRALGGGELEGSLPELKVTAAAVHANRSGKKVTLRPVAATLLAEGFRLPKKGTGSPAVKRASCTVSAADALVLTAEGGVSGLAKQVASSRGKLAIDLGRLLPVVATFLPAGIKGDGAAAASWDVAAPLPVIPLPKKDNPLRRARVALALLDRGELSLKLDRLNLRVPAGQGAYLVRNLSTAPLLRVSVPRPGGAPGLDAALTFDAVSGLAGGAGKLPLQSGTFTLQGELVEWKELRLTQELRLASLGLSQVAELTVGRIDTLLDGQAQLDTATLLKRLDATMFAHLDGNFPREAKQMLPGLLLSGNVSAGARVDLTAARELRLRGYTKCRDFGVADGKGMAASGIRADLVVDRAFALAQGRGDDWAPLSALLVRPAPVSPLRAGNSDLAARIYDDLRGETSGARKIGIRSASLRSGSSPLEASALEASALEADLLLEPEVLGLSFFQAEVGGGTVRARGVIDLARDVPVLSTYCNFSRLDPVLLFPAAGATRPGEEGELTGELNFSAPLATEQRALLEGLRLNLNLRRFSSRVLDRALFAIDPYQRNEKVVAQRKSLKLADLKGLRVSAVDGALDCEGELLVKGVGVDIPKLERLRLSELPIRKELERVVAGIASSRALLDLVRADTLVVGPKGELSLKRRTNEK